MKIFNLHQTVPSNDPVEASTHYLIQARSNHYLRENSLG